jgi:elongation factor Ts
MAVAALLVKELRERTGAGMMECKKALVESGGDIDAAIELMRKSGQAKAAKKAGRTAADGVVVVELAPDGEGAVLLEVNCETDFVAKDASFTAFAESVAACALASGAADIAALQSLPLVEGEVVSIAQVREALVAKIGENIQLRRLVRFDDVTGRVYSYRHGVRIGVLVEMDGGDASLGKDIAMHIAATNPMCIAPEQVPTEILDKEKEIFRVQALDTGKPEKIVDKIVDGRVRKYLQEVTLLGQAFVKDTNIRVEELLARAGAKVLRFSRLEVGEGIEKRQESFAEEVMAQVRNADAPET